MKRQERVIEKRGLAVTGPDVLRVDQEGNTLTGYAAKFGKWSGDLGGFREKISRKAFTQTLKEADVRALFNHDPNLILGRTASGTLKLGTDDSGLIYEVNLPDTSFARDLKESINRQDITQNSFAFTTIKDKWTSREDGSTERELLEVRLFDVSPVTYPAYEDTELKLRSLFGAIGVNHTLMVQLIARSEVKELSEEEKEELRNMIIALQKVLETDVKESPVRSVLDNHSLVELEYYKFLYGG